MSSIGTRANVQADVSVLTDCDPPRPGDAMISPTNVYLGGFSTLKPFPSSAPGQEFYPSAWTNGTWGEQSGLKHCVDGSCVDCNGGHVFHCYEQRENGEVVPGAYPATLFEFYDFSIHPKGIVAPGCTPVCTEIPCRCGTCVACACGSPCGESSAGCGRCGRNNSRPLSFRASGNPALDLSQVTRGWPLVPFGSINPSSYITTTADPTGPPCLEDVPALEINFSGAGFEGASWIGEGGGFGDTPDAEGYNPSGIRSATGWAPEDGSCWTCEFWVRAVPDYLGDSGAIGWTISTKYGFWPWPFGELLLDGSKTLVLDGTWQFYSFTFQVAYGNPLNPTMSNAMLFIYTLDSRKGYNPTPPEIRPLYARNGRVLIKNVHLYPCVLGEGDGVRVKRPSGLRS